MRIVQSRHSNRFYVIGRAGRVLAGPYDTREEALAVMRSLARSLARPAKSDQSGRQLTLKSVPE